LQEIHCRRNLQ